jgi:hypothetical protein
MDDSTSPLDGFSSLLRLSGATVPARARFVGAATFSGIYTGTTVGLVCGQLGAILTPFGPLLPFLFGSGVGFCLGLYTTWNNAVKMTYVYANHYPHLLAHALWTDSRIIVPSSVLPPIVPDSENDTETRVATSNMPTTMVEWIKCQGMREFSFCVLAAQTCEKDVGEADELVRQRLIEATAATRSLE